MLLPVMPSFTDSTSTTVKSYLKTADLNQIAAGINLLLYNRPIAVTKQTLNVTSIPVGTWTTVAFDTVEWDSAGGFSSDGSAYTCQLAGRYQISGLMEFKLETTPTGDRGVRATINGGAAIGLGAVAAAGDVITGVPFSEVVYLAAGDVLAFQALSSQATSTVVNWNANANEASFFDLFWIGA